MKNKIFLLGILLSAFCMNVQGQYFYRTYGNVGVDLPLSSGTNTIAMGLGHIMAGVSGTRLQVTRTDVAGAPIFNNFYGINNSAGAPLTLLSVQITEVSATAMVLIGSYRDGAAEGLFFLNLTQLGGLTNLRTYRWTLPTVSNTIIRGMFNSANTRFYVAGSATYATAAGTGTYPVGAAFDVAGNNLWARIYTSAGATLVMEGHDVELFAGTNQLYLVGSYRTAAGALADGFMFRVDPGTGNSLNGLRYGTNNTEDYFTGITTSTSLALGGVTGLMISGSSNSRPVIPANMDCWGMKINNAGGVLGSRLYDYSPTANRDNYSHDVIERRNAVGVPTYFYTGYVRGGVFGNNDVHVVKTDDLMASTGNYTYGTALSEIGEMSTANNNLGIGGFAGLGIYSTVSQGAPDRDFLLVKSYFNGVTQCNSSLNPPNTNNGPGIIADLGVTPVNSVGLVGSVFTGPSAANNILVCNNFTVAGGSNAKTAEGDDADAQDFNIDINAVSGVSNLSAITLSATESVNATVEVVNLLGATLFRSEMKLNEGNNTLPGTGDLATGIVVVRVVAENGMVFTKKVLIQ